MQMNLKRKENYYFFFFCCFVRLSANKSEIMPTFNENYNFIVIAIIIDYDFFQGKQEKNAISLLFFLFLFYPFRSIKH